MKAALPPRAGYARNGIGSRPARLQGAAVQFASYPDQFQRRDIDAAALGKSVARDEIVVDLGHHVGEGAADPYKIIRCVANHFLHKQVVF